MDLVPQLDSQALKELGIGKVGDRITLQISIKDMRNNSTMSKIPLSSLVQALSSEEDNTATTFILQDGTKRKVKVAGCFNADSIKRKVIRKLGLKSGPDSWDTYVTDEIGTLHLMFDVELVTNCHSSDRAEKHRILFCPQPEVPSRAAIEVSKKIIAKSGPLGVRQQPEAKLAPSVNPAFRQFFGQRPPSELISHNLGEYFPEAEPKELQSTVRNSIRYSMRLPHLSPQSTATRHSIVSRTIGGIYAEETTLKRQSVAISTASNKSVIELFSDGDDDEYDEISGNDMKWFKGARIGSGSFGTVFLGMNAFTGELMAVKQVEMPTQGSATKQHQNLMLDALNQEMSLLKDMNHDNIVQYLGSNSDQNFLNIFLEYVPGGSVASMLNNYGPFEEPLIRSFIRQTLTGLHYLHGEKIIHRDIKGANILIDIKGTVKISDFGISKKLNSSLQSKRASLQGSVYWMAPEVVKQIAYTEKADIWSVGCLVVEMFTGKHPFPDFSQMQAIFKIGTQSIPEIPAWATEDAKQFLLRTFVFDYKQRPTASQLLDDEFMDNLIVTKK